MMGNPDAVLCGYGHRVLLEITDESETVYGAVVAMHIFPPNGGAGISAHMNKWAFKEHIERCQKMYDKMYPVT